MNTVIQTLGRKLRLGVVGGGPGSFVGPLHRSAALLHERYDVVAAALCSDAQRSRSAARALGIPRGYGDGFELISAEAHRTDGIDVLAILTPNASHAALAAQAMQARMAIMCEKPLTTDLESADRLAALQKKYDTVFLVAMVYSAYAMVRQARAMIADGVLGKVRLMHVSYVQGHLAKPVTQTPQGVNNWHFNPEMAGPSLILSDIGTHAFHLLSFVSGLLPEQICADVTSLVPENEIDDYCGMLMRYRNGARATLQITQAAAGGVHGLTFSIYGEHGGLTWAQAKPNELIYKPIKGPVQLLCRGADYLHPAAHMASHVALGHPEGYREAFATLYLELSEAFVAQKHQQAAPPFLWHPTLDDGLQGVRFVAAGVRSREENGAWVEF